MAYIQFLGAAGTVTGSKHLINTSGDVTGQDGMQVLVDCGMFQGRRSGASATGRSSPIPARTIDAASLTHAHLDHCGWIPRLVKEGFTGPIYATSATIDLCGIILPDSGHLQEEDAAFYNKIKKSKHDPALPLYTLDEAKECLKYFQPVGHWRYQAARPELSFRFVRAAHILGSCMAEVTLTTQRTNTAPAFHRRHWPGARQEYRSRERSFTRARKRVKRADVLVMESTYGNRVHPDVDPRPELAAAIRKTIERGGSVVVPAFAVERTQKFLFMLKELMESGQIPHVPVFADSPMAIKAVEIYLKHSEEYSDEAKRLIGQYGSPLTWPGFSFASTSAESKKINDSRYPCIIISSSGMVTGGRIQHHLAQRLPDPRTR